MNEIHWEQYYLSEHAFSSDSRVPSRFVSRHTVEPEHDARTHTTTFFIAFRLVTVVWFFSSAGLFLPQSFCSTDYFDFLLRNNRYSFLIRKCLKYGQVYYYCLERLVFLYLRNILFPGSETKYRSGTDSPFYNSWKNQTVKI